jgi:tetratricopeptide (TPR) repeat protein
MARAAEAPGIDSQSGMDARLAALAKLEAMSEELGAEYKRKASNDHLRAAVKAWRAGDIQEAGQEAFTASEIDESNAKAFHVLAMYLERMGHQHKALVTYERAYKLDPDDPELLINLGLTAWNLKLCEGAARMFSLYIAALPDSPLGYNNLGSILGDMGETDKAIETLRGAILRLPGEAILWNALATVLAEAGRVEESLIFYREAIRLDPEFARLYHNLGYAYQHLGMLPEALEAYDHAAKRAVDPLEIRETTHSRSICLLGMGKLEEGFRGYEIRANDRFRAYVHHMLKAPVWKGEPLRGKRLLVVGEQGLGDEIMFANVLPDLQDAVGPEGTLQIAVDSRLVPLFQRSFPEAEVGCYEDRTLLDKDGDKALRFVPFATAMGEPDYYTLMGSPLVYFRKRLEDFPHTASLIPDPQRTARYRAALKAKGGETLVGICWRSMMIDAKRAKYYSTLEQWGPLLKTAGVRFINLQYGECAAELEGVRALHGIAIESMEGLDLQNDIDGAAALSAAVDLVISAPTAAAAAAAAVGSETWFLTAGRTWPQLGTGEFPWYRKTRVFSPENFGDWDALMPRLAAELAAFAPAAS